MITIAQQNRIKEILSPFQPKEIGVFGSYARGDNKKDSDLDLLVAFGKKINLLELVGIELELSEAIGIKVDLVTKNSLSPLIKKIVEKDLRLIA